MNFEDVETKLIKFNNLVDYKKHFFTNATYENECEKRDLAVKILTPNVLAESEIENHESGQKYIDIRIGDDKTSDNFYDFLVEMDNLCLKTIMDNSKKWFGKAVSKKRVEHVYQSIFSPDDENVIRVWFPYGKEVPIYTADGYERVSQPP